MKILMFIGIVFLFLSACDDDETTPQIPIFLPGPMTYGYADMDKNGVAIRASAVAEKQREFIGENLFSIHFYTFNEFGFFKESLGIGYFPFEAGEYIFPFNEFSDIELQGYGVISDASELREDGYDMDPTYKNIVTLEEVDTIQNIVKGTFDLRFTVRKPKNNVRNPDVVTFSNGIINTQFQN